jgi:cytochrome d ubiquinol oxidase subunit I
VGDWAARDVTKTQPVKLAAIEGLYETTHGASEHILGWYTHGQVKYGIAIPHLLSLLATHSWNGKVTGLQTVPADQRPAINIVRFAFQAMVGIGTLLGLLALWLFAVWVRRKRLPESPWFYRAVVLAGPLSLVALIAGWVVTEVGRQPWVVYRVMPTAAAVTGAHGIPVGYGTLAASYLVVACGLAWVLRRLARAPLRLVDESEAGLEAA